MLTLGILLFVIALAAIFFNSTSWPLLPIFFVLYVFAIQKDKEWKAHAKYEETSQRLMRKEIEDYPYIIIERATGKIFDRFETLEEAKKANAKYNLKYGRYKYYLKNK